MRKKYAPEHVMIRDGVYYYVRHIPCDLASIYSVTRLCFSLKTKSLKAAIRTSKSVTQRLEDYWLGLRLQNMDIPAIQVVKSGDTHENDTLLMSEACELYLWLKGLQTTYSIFAFRPVRFIVGVQMVLYYDEGICTSHKRQILMVLFPLNAKPHQSSQMLLGFCVGTWYTL